MSWNGRETGQWLATLPAPLGPVSGPVSRTRVCAVTEGVDSHAQARAAFGAGGPAVPAILSWVSAVAVPAGAASGAVG